ncbi:hypothetical protein [Polyangium jinanense]|uniref:DUF1835 domain-containing protein n=1 Tax=Polyangium jinanense TaxID=2829994 RepID=A0A9X3XCG8_9BACT|nr:hypothetical protein [Polyangium jinanense]MDC3959549.1 hypothetical protein [Polyangium jinanense]MDC3986148.1 hypothetical protein [Polyangium jinanense]
MRPRVGTILRRNASNAGSERAMTIHIATSSDVALAVRRGMRVAVRSMNDGLLVGPCAPDLEDHMRLRRDFWADVWPYPPAYVPPFRRVLADLAAAEPVVVWTSLKWMDRVALWAYCAYRLQHHPTQPDLSLIFIGEYGERHARLSFGIVYVTLEPAMARRAWGTARSLSRREVREKALFWRKLTAPSPILSGKRLRETPSRKEFFELGAYQAGLFPRLSERSLSLSTLDALLLGCVNKTPSNPARILMRRGSKGEELRRWLSLTGDIVLFERLAQWAERGALHAKSWTAPNGWQTAKYTLSATGRSLLRDGLSSIDQAPPFPIWGVTAYDPKNPWVVVEEAGGRPHLRRLGERTR